MFQLNGRVLGLLLSVLCSVYCEVTVLKVTQTIYDASPKLRIRGTGFDALESDIYLTFGNSNQSLTQNRDYILTKDSDGDGLILKLMSPRRWVEIGSRIPPIGLILSAVYFGASSTTNLLYDPVVIANVLSTPSVTDNSTVAYARYADYLYVSGTGWIGAKKIDIYFNPPLYKEVVYEDVTSYPLMSNQVTLRLRNGYTWREDAGPLLVVGIDTGGGPVKLNGDDGVLIGSIVDDAVLLPDVFENSQLIYANALTLTIQGTRFNPTGNTLRFDSGILGINVNYSTFSSSANSIVLLLTPGSSWIGTVDTDRIPVPLTLLAVNSGEGFVAVGPNKRGAVVATVYPVPVVSVGETEVFLTESQQLTIRGSGFPLLTDSECLPLLRFNTGIVQGVDYTMNVVSHTEIELTLMAARKWSTIEVTSQGIPLQVVGINTRCDEVGWIDMNTQVAKVVVDPLPDPVLIGSVQLNFSRQKVYQSLGNTRLELSGSGFRAGVSLIFNPPLILNVHYTMTLVGTTQMFLLLRSGQQWRSEPGPIEVTAITEDGVLYSVGNEGIQVAEVLADPHITTSTVLYHQTQSHLVTITGSGFTNVNDVKVTLAPTSPGVYKVLSVANNSIVLQLTASNSWLPSFLDLSQADDGKQVALQVSSIDTGAGVIYLANYLPYVMPTVGYIVKDIPYRTCDDSCVYAFDGHCDDIESVNKPASGPYKCVPSTDCTDCGGVEVFSSCVNTCMYSRDGVCDDPRGTKYCDLGTDCQDCGPVGADNFTRSDDDGWWDDDDDYWTFNDGDFNPSPIQIDPGSGDYNPDIPKTDDDSHSDGSSVFWVIWLSLFVFLLTAILVCVFLMKQKKMNVNIVGPASIVEMSKYVALPQSDANAVI